uniref:Uncharacterized protein n=1 Tax=Tanacetum cinerariifolium TaxID=118510 RepID=A0A6L2MX64_TANCI|nr:hypothetical protein [Tanacetum cinerariifolium]
MAQQIIPPAQLVSKFQGIERCNNYVVLQSIPSSPQCKIVRKTLLSHPLSYSLTATVDVLAMIGYQGVVDKVSAFYTKFLAQPWQTMFKIIITALMEKYPSIPQQLNEDYHSIKDATSLKLDEEEIERMVEGGEDEESYASEFVDSMLNDDVADSGTRIEPESHKEHSENVNNNDEVIKKEKTDEVIEMEKQNDGIEKQKKDDDFEKMDEIEK